jgi:hypothetical protein
MKRIIASIVIGLLLIEVGGCIFADGFTSPRSVVLSSPGQAYSLVTDWEGERFILTVETNNVYRLQTPYLASGTTYWLGFIPHHYIHGEDLPFLHVYEGTREVITLSPRQLWRLGKDQSGIARLNMK